MIGPLPEGTTLVSVAPDTLFSPNMPPVEAYRVTFRTPQGVQTHVKVARSDNWVQDAVNAIVNENAMMYELHNHFGAVHPIKHR